MKVGDLIYCAWVDEGTVHLDEAVLRTVRGPFGYIIDKVPGVTWGKRSTKHGDFGWLDPVPSLYRTRFRVADGLPDGYGMSKSGALRSRLASERRYRERYADSPEALAEADADIAALMKRLARVKSAR